MFCPNCETENRDDAKFCNECGFPLNGAIARAAGGASPTPARNEAEALFDFPVKDTREEALFDQFPSIPAMPEEPKSNDSFFAPHELSYANSKRRPSVKDLQGAPEEDAQDESQAYSQPKRVRVNFDELPLRAADLQPDQPRRNDRFDGFAEETPDESENEHKRGRFPIIGTAETSGLDRFATGSILIDDDPIMSSPAAEPEPEYAAEGTQPYQATERIMADERPLEESSFWDDDNTMQMPVIDSAEQSRARDFRVAPEADKGARKRRIAAGVAIGVVVIAAAVAFITWSMELWGGIAVPDVTQMTAAEATKVLEDEGFIVRTTQVKSDETEGLVIITDPTAGSRAEEGTEVVIHIATPRLVPDVIGRNADEAAAMLKESGYENVTYEQVKSDKDENLVLSITPEPGTRAKSTTGVVVQVSEAYTVPDVTDMTVDEALKAIEAEGLESTVIYIDTTQYPDGTVLGTEQEAGAKVKSDTVVALNVARARGAELIALSQEYLAAGAEVNIGEYEYRIENVTTLEYVGDDTVSFTVTATPFMYFYGDLVYASSQQTVTGNIVWNENNEIVSVS